MKRATSVPKLANNPFLFQSQDLLTRSRQAFQQGAKKKVNNLSHDSSTNSTGNFVGKLKPNQPFKSLKMSVGTSSSYGSEEIDETNVATFQLMPTTMTR